MQHTTGDLNYYFDLKKDSPYSKLITSKNIDVYNIKAKEIKKNIINDIRYTDEEYKLIEFLKENSDKDYKPDNSIKTKIYDLIKFLTIPSLKKLISKKSIDTLLHIGISIHFLILMIKIIKDYIRQKNNVN